MFYIIFIYTPFIGKKDNFMIKDYINIFLIKNYFLINYNILIYIYMYSKLKIEIMNMVIDIKCVCYTLYRYYIFLQ